jgi:hypothetical protein
VTSKIQTIPHSEGIGKVLARSEIDRFIKTAGLNVLLIFHFNNTCINNKWVGFKLYIILITKLHSPKDSKSIS